MEWPYGFLLSIWGGLCLLRLTNIVVKFLNHDEQPYFRYGFDILVFPVAIFRFVVRQLCQSFLMGIEVITSEIKYIPMNIKVHLRGWRL